MTPSVPCGRGQNGWAPCAPPASATNAACQQPCEGCTVTLRMRLAECVPYRCVSKQTWANGEQLQYGRRGCALGARRARQAAHNTTRRRWAGRCQLSSKPAPLVMAYSNLAFIPCRRSGGSHAGLWHASGCSGACWLRLGPPVMPHATEPCYVETDMPRCPWACLFSGVSRQLEHAEARAGEGGSGEERDSQGC